MSVAGIPESLRKGKTVKVTISGDDVGIGGGTQYTEGDTDTTITGNAMLAEGPSNTLEALQLDSSKHLQVDIAADSVGIGGGTQYTEDAVAAAEPVGNAQILVREDAPTSIAVDGDNVARRGTQYGAAYSQIVDSSGNFVDTFGGGTQYTEADTDATITGTALMMEDAANTLRAATGDTTNGLDVDVTRVNGTVTVDGSGVTQPVSGTITANLGATDNAVLDNIDSNTGYGAITGGGVEASALRVTLANDSTGVLSVDDNGGSLTVDGTVTANLSATDNAVLDNIDSNTDYGSVTGGGTEASALRVTLANNSTGVISVDDNGSTLSIDDGGGAITVDGTVTANLSSTDNTVLDNIDTNTTDIPNVIGTDGAAGPTNAISIAGTESGGNLQELLVDSDGHLQVDILSGGGSNASVKTDDSAFTVASDSVTAIGAMLDDTATDSVDEGDVGVVRMSADRRLLVDADIVAQSTGDITIADGGNSITVDGTVTANLSATDNTVLDNIDSNTDYGATTGGGTESGALRVTIANNSTGVISVDDNGSTLSIDDGGGAITVDGTVSVTDGLNIEGDVANDGADSGNPLKIGGRAQDPWAQPEEVADNDRVDALFDENGYQRVRGDLDPKYADINDSTSGNNTIIAAAGAGKRIAVWAVAVVSDGTVDVRFEDGAGGTAFTGQIPLQAREGFTHSAGGLVPLWVGSANTLLNLELSAAVNVHGTVSYTVMDD